MTLCTRRCQCPPALEPGRLLLSSYFEALSSSSLGRSDFERTCSTSAALWTAAIQTTYSLPPPAHITLILLVTAGVVGRYCTCRNVVQMHDTGIAELCGQAPGRSGACMPE